VSVVVGVVAPGVVGTSLRLARQVTKPLDDLERAAGDLGAGDLDARAPVPDGPPELHRLAESFNATATRLQDLVASQQAFVADASHQLRTPLAALRLRSENLEGELDQVAPAAVAADLSEDATGALVEVERLSRLVDGLLELARAEQVEGAPEPVELAVLVGERVDAWAALADERNVALLAEVPDALRASSTPGRLEQVLDNLVANALDVAPAGSAVRVIAARANGTVELSVVDAGPGMPPEQRARAFDRFWRPSGADRDGGSGLGLAIVARLVTADGGTVALHEAPGGGLAATVTLRPA
jgi:signal transduction histidine kinase